jgi:hypothetical protein
VEITALEYCRLSSRRRENLNIMELHCVFFLFVSSVFQVLSSLFLSVIFVVSICRDVGMTVVEVFLDQSYRRKVIA